MVGRAPPGQTEASGLILGKAPGFHTLPGACVPSQGPACFLAPGRSGARSCAAGWSVLGGAGLGCLDYARPAMSSLGIILLIYPCSRDLGTRWNGHPVLFFLGSKNSLLKDAMAPGTPKVGGQLRFSSCSFQPKPSEMWPLLRERPSPWSPNCLRHLIGNLMPGAAWCVGGVPGVAESICVEDLPVSSCPS